MKSEELRLGNMVNYEQTTHVITEISRTHVRSYWINAKEEKVSNDYVCLISEIEPISLTEEWLLKLGFTCDKNKMYRNNRISVNYGNQDEVVIHGPNGGYAIPFQYNNQTVHWMQNLYFALTGKELEVRP